MIDMTTCTIFLAQNFSTEPPTPSHDPSPGLLSNLDPGLGILVFVLALAVSGLALMLLATDRPLWQWRIGPGLIITAIAIAALGAEEIEAALQELLIAGVALALLGAGFGLWGKSGSSR